MIETLRRVAYQNDDAGLRVVERFDYCCDLHANDYVSSEQARKNVLECPRRLIIEITLVRDAMQNPVWEPIGTGAHPVPWQIIEALRSLVQARLDEDVRERALALPKEQEDA